MGIDIEACSNIETKPVPEKFRSTLTYEEPYNLKQKIDIINNTNYEKKDKLGLLSLLMQPLMLSNVSDLNQINNTCYIDPKPDVLISDEAYAWEKNEKNTNNLYHIDWETNTCYYKTNLSKVLETHRSYSGIGNFCGTIAEFTNSRFDFPFGGILSVSTCNKHCNIMKNVWNPWIKKYFPKYKLPLDIDEINENNYKSFLDDSNEFGDWELEFYMSLYIVLKCGANCGIVRCF